MKRTYFKNARKHPQYDAYMAMFKRCYSENDSSYKNYGARGIKVCDSWFDFATYLADIGERKEGMFLDRVDNNGNYEPSNIRWATSTEQNKNKRNNRYVILDGIETLLIDAAKKLNKNYYSFHQSMKKNNFQGDAREYC
jgi:hypothetical protein